MKDQSAIHSEKNARVTCRVAGLVTACFQSYSYMDGGKGQLGVTITKSKGLFQINNPLFEKASQLSETL